jgi:hypothetical protein
MAVTREAEARRSAEAQRSSSIRLSLTGGQVGCMMYTSELRTFSRIWMLTWRRGEEGEWCVWREVVGWGGGGGVGWWWWGGVGWVGGGGGGCGRHLQLTRLRVARCEMRGGARRWRGDGEEMARRCEEMARRWRGDGEEVRGDGEEMRTSPSAKREMVAGVSGTPSRADISWLGLGLGFRV